MIFIFGSARSGSTWLAKLFDSHPELLYLHEPDIPDRGSDLLPHWFERSPTPDQIENAKMYLQRLALRRDPRTIGTTPMFGKAYRSAPVDLAYRSLVLGTKLIERAGAAKFAAKLHVPDLVFGPHLVPLVIKSVSALGRAEALVAASDSMKPILLIRHPCGFVNSMLRGKLLGAMPSAPQLGRLAHTRSALRLGFTPDALEVGSELALLAWTWLLSYAEALPAIQQAGGRVLIYEELVSEPARHIKDLFQSLSLGWPRQTEEFLMRSRSVEGNYYSVFRGSGEASERWRSELSNAAIAEVRSIVDRDALGSQFFRS